MSRIVCAYTWYVIFYFFFFFNDTATTEIYTLSLHDALPISHERGPAARGAEPDRHRHGQPRPPHARSRSEEHTSELQSPCNLVCRLLLEKKNRPIIFILFSWFGLTLPLLDASDWLR